MKKLLSILLVFAMFAGILPGTALAVRADDDVWIYGTTRTVNDHYNNKFKLIKGVYYYPSAVAVGNASVDLPAVFYYSDGFFEEDRYTYSNSLATTSLNMAMAAFYSNDGGTGETGNYAIKGDSIGQFLLDIGCERDKIYANYFNKIRPQMDSIGVTIAQKNLKEADGTETGRILIPIAIRGANYEKEWASNVTLGNESENEGEAKGFSSAAQIVFNEIQGYIQNYGLQEAIEKGKVTFWIAGYSRAGATTNLTARRLVDTYGQNKGNGGDGNRIYAYCIEAPQGGWKGAEKFGSNYSCIHSVINKSDLVPRVAPGAMSFQRYGTDHYIPGTNAGTRSGYCDNKEYEVNSSAYDALKPSMLSQLKAVNPNIKFNDSFQAYGLDTRQLKAALASVATVSLFLTPPVGLITAIQWAVGIGLQDKGKGAVIRKGSYMSMDTFLNDFFNNLCKWTTLDREKYVNGSFNQGNLQDAARDYMAAVFDSTPKEKEDFKNALQKMWDDQVGILDLVGVFKDAFGEWHKPGFTKKTYYINKMIKWLNDSKVYDTLNLSEAEKDRLLNKDLPVLVDLIMTYLSMDYRNELYGTNGMSQLFTFLGSSSNIMSNHYPEVNLAWLRAQDPLYKNETGSVNVRTPEKSTARLYLDGEPVFLPNLYDIQIHEKDLLDAKKLEIRMPENALYSERVRYRFSNMEEGSYRDGGALSQNKLSERIVSLNGTGKYNLIIEQTFHDSVNTLTRWSYKLDVLSDGILLHLTNCVNGEIVKNDSDITDKKILITTEDPAGKVFEKWQIKVIHKNESGSVSYNYEIGTRDAAIDVEGAQWKSGDEVTAVAVFADTKGSSGSDPLLHASDAAAIIQYASATDDPDEDALTAEASSLNISETNIPDTDIPETGITEADVPETGITEADIPETGITEADVPEENIPETDVSEAGITEADIPETDVPEAGIREENVPGTGIPEGDITLEDIAGEAAASNTESEEKTSAPDAQTVSAMDITMDQPMNGSPLANRVSSCTLTRTDGSSYSIDPEKVEVEWEPSPVSFWDEDKKEYYYGNASECTAYTAYLRVMDDSFLNEESMNPDASITINGEFFGTVACFVEVLDDNGDVVERGYCISVSFPETDSTSITWIEEPDELLLEHAADIAEELPQTLPAVLSDNSTQDVPVAWNIDGAEWLVYDKKAGSWVRMEYYDINNPEPMQAEIIGNAGNASVAAHVYIAGLPDAHMPEASRVEGEYSEPISVELIDGAEHPRIYYTLDGTDPRSSTTALRYENPISLGDTPDTMDVYLLAYSESPDSTQYDDSDVNVWHYSFVKPDLKNCTVELSNTRYTYNGKAKKPRVTVKDDAVELTPGTDYTVSYKNNTNAGKAKVVVTGKGKYTGVVEKEFKIDPAALKSAATVTIPYTSLVYNGKTRTQTVKTIVKAKINGKTIKLVLGTDYKISYKNNTKVGTAAMTITGKGNYTGSINKTFKIVPKATTLSSVKSTKKGSLKVRWKILTTQTSGYQIQYARNSKFTSGSVTKTLASNKTVEKVWSGLKSGMKYWVRIRTYKTVNGKKYYSAWSKAKTVTIK